MPKSIRSFIAFDIKNDKILRALSEVQEKFTQSGADLKIVKPENIHITMRFLGDIQPKMIGKIHSEMKQIPFKPFDIEIQGIGAFPKASYARVIWTGIQQGANELRMIFNQLEPRLQNLGFKPDRKGFSPHITIARVKTSRNKTALIQCINELANSQIGILKGKCLKLKKSILTPKGPIYSTLKEICKENQGVSNVSKT